MPPSDAQPAEQLTRQERVAQARLLIERYGSNLRLLHSVLAASPMAGRVALFAGLLLGMVRDGRMLPGDLDADFYYLEEDNEPFATLINLLLTAGFQRLFRLRANDGEIWQHTFHKDRAKFEFFRCRRTEPGELRYYDFVPMDPPRQQLKRYLDGPWQPITIDGCDWLAPADLDAALTMQYGDWRTPDPNWRWDRDPLTLKIEPWHHRDEMRWDE